MPTRVPRNLSKSSVAQPICRTQLIRNMNMNDHKKQKSCANNINFYNIVRRNVATQYDTLNLLQFLTPVTHCSVF